MRYGLFLTDMAAVLIGLFGAYTAAVFATGTDWAEVAGGELALFHYGTLLFLGAMAAAFLVPPVYQATVRATFSVPGRLVLCLMIPAWLVLGAAGFADRAREGRSFLLWPPFVETYPFLLGGVCLLLLLLVFPFGLSYSDLRAERRALRDAARIQAAERAMQAAAVPAGRGAGRDTRVVAEKGGILGGIISVPILAAGLAGLAAWRFGDVARSAEVDGFVRDNIVPGSVALLALFCAQMLLTRLAYPQARNPYLAGKPVRHAVAALFGAPLMAFGVFLMGGHHAVPYAAVALTEKAERTFVYEVERVLTGRRSRGCVTLSFAAQAGLPRDQRDETGICTLDRSFVSGLGPGDRLEVTGAANRFGQRFERVRLLR